LDPLIVRVRDADPAAVDSGDNDLITGEFGCENSLTPNESVADKPPPGWGVRTRT